MSSLKGKPKGSSFSKQLSIQLNVCKRMQKESSYYLKEVEENKAKVQKMKDEGKDPFDIKKQEEVLEESVMMVPDSKRRYGESVEKLVQLLENESGSYEESDETVIQARNFIAAHKEEAAEEQK